MKKLLLVLSVPFLVNCGGGGASFSLPQQQQSFGQVITYNNKVDILFVIDNSKSMSQHQQRLAARVPDMISALNSLGMDYHVGVTTTTMAKSTAYPETRQLVGEPKFLTRDSIQLLTDRIIVGEAGSDLERGLDAMVYVTGSYATQNAPGFIRSDALFVAVFLGDEDDQSSEFGSSSTEFITYMNKFKPPFKEGGRAWIANFIGTLQNQNCDNLGGFVSIGTRYIALVDASNGVKNSICDADLASAVSNIKARVIDQLVRFHLSSQPNKSTLKVTVDGVAINEDPVNGWTLETEVSGTTTNYFLKFHGSSIPKENGVVRVDFKPATAS